LDDHRADHQRHDRVCRYAERQHRNERRLGAGVVGGFRGSNAFDGTLAEAPRTAGQTLFDRIGGERRENGAAARQNSEHGAKCGAAQDGRNDRLQIVLAGEQVGDLPDHDVTLGLVFEVAKNLGYAEDTHCDGDEIQTIGKFQAAQSKARRAGIDIGADQPQKQAQHDHGDGLKDRAMGKSDRGDKA
jgi:hypothetical protein